MLRVRSPRVSQPGEPRGGPAPSDDSGHISARGGGRRAGRGAGTQGGKEPGREGAGRAGPAGALPEAAVLRALGDVVRPLQKRLLPPQLAGPERLRVHLVFCRDAGGASEGAADWPPGTRAATDALLGRISVIATNRQAPARHPVALHTFPRKTLAP